MAGGVGELVQQDEGVLAAVDDQALLVVACGRIAEDTASFLVGLQRCARAATVPRVAWPWPRAYISREEGLKSCT
jgi:hypothetical protein